MNDDDVTPIESGKKKLPPVSTSVLEQLSPDAKKAFWDGAFQKLTESQRFLEFVDANYTIGVTVNEEQKIRETYVIEKPTAVGPKLQGEQVFKMQVACTRSGAKDPVALLNHLLRILGQEPKSSIITAADDAELKRAVADADAQEKLKQGLED